MSAFPDCIIQIHYHLRKGGVNTVIGRYSDTFLQITANTENNIIIASTNGIKSKNQLLIDIPECDYHYINTADQFIQLKNVLIEKIENVFLSIQCKTVAIIAHNLSLAKNPALSSAVCFLSKKYSSERFRFFSVIHDFSEEGRTNLMEQIRLLEDAGVNIKDDLYGEGGIFYYVVPSENSFQLLKKSHFPVTLLRNPIDFKFFDSKQFTKDILLPGLINFAKNNDLTLDIDKKIFYYPVRIISRKNLIEAIVLACIGCGGALFTGPCGSSSIDKCRFTTISGLIKKYNLPVLLDAGGVAQNVNVPGTYVVPLLYAICDMAISTSISEGFGYGLYEPWALKKPAICRKPAGFITPEDWNDSVFYTHFPIPVEWISVESVNKKYADAFYQCYHEKISWNLQDIIKDTRTVDFSILDESTQITVLESVLKDPLKLNEWKSLLHLESSLWPGIDNLYNSAIESVPKHYHSLCRNYSFDEHKNQFEFCFSQIPVVSSGTIDIDTIQKEFQSPEYFKLLLNPSGFSLNTEKL